MSSFGGTMREYPHCSIDRFDHENLQARAYFLSHCHKGETTGPSLAPRLSRRGVCLYCSPVTKELLLSNPRYKFWENHIVSYLCSYVVVTLLPAGHCPGSVMFLFQGENGTVLYTGDFRLASGEVARMELLHSGNVCIMFATKFSSTLIHPKFMASPECMKGILELVRSWITLSPYHVVWLNCKAAYGYEYLFIHLSEELGVKVHVNHLDMFKNMPEILYHVTLNRYTQIHACRHPKDDEFFRRNKLPCGTTSQNGKQLHIITEPTIQDFLKYICPVNVYPNVIPAGGDDDLFDTELVPLKCKIPKLLAKTTSSQNKLLPKYHQDSNTSCFRAFSMPMLKVDFIECEEANDEDEDEDEEEESKIQNENQQQSDLQIPKWDAFFKCHMEDTDTFEHEDNAPPVTDSSEPQSPNLYSDNEDLSDSTHISSQNSSQSTHISEQESQGWDSQMDTVLISSQERRILELSSFKRGLDRAMFFASHLSPGESKMDLQSGRPWEQGVPSSNKISSECKAKVQEVSRAAPTLTHSVQTQSAPERCKEESCTLGPEAQQDSQSSSDFEVPPTPGAEVPKADQLCNLYIKLAAGESLN
uniref:DNA cross-link repair 1C n=1 Tax=Varanus komodoensis TaxID=61221 RepID=A0A8D2KY93_VARKO